ncbi:MAG TPA: metallophosphoesterase [Chitinophagaceae bacterium]|nr:metallophosphoesterase [Chitinophagaceae bacterium]
MIERNERINLFGGHENLSIMHISDIHLWYSVSVLDKLKAIITLRGPGLIILTGDYYDLPVGAYHFRAFLREIAQQCTVIFIKGNHDVIYGKKVLNLLSGIDNCFSAENAVYAYQSKKGHRYNITAWKNKHALPAGNNDKNILLIHNPEKIKVKELSNIHLILAGHLHGGQFVFFKTKNKANFPGCIFYKYCCDRKQIGGTTLIVSKGLGDTFPLRINCPKEVVNITIE